MSLLGTNSKLLVSIIGLLAFQLDGFASDTMACVIALNVPTSNVASRFAESGGIVEASVLVGRKGNIARMTVRGPEEALKIEVEAHLRQSRFRIGCAGRTLQFVFSFQFEGEPTKERLPPKVIFEPPNRFSIVSQRAVPIID